MSTDLDREAALKFAEKEFGPGPDAEMHAGSYLAGLVAGRKLEREACAKLAREEKLIGRNPFGPLFEVGWAHASERIAKIIRERT